MHGDIVIGNINTFFISWYIETRYKTLNITHSCYTSGNKNIYGLIKHDSTHNIYSEMFQLLFGKFLFNLREKEIRSRYINKYINIERSNLILLALYSKIHFQLFPIDA